MTQIFKKYLGDFKGDETRRALEKVQMGKDKPYRLDGGAELAAVKGGPLGDLERVGGSFWIDLLSVHARIRAGFTVSICATRRYSAPELGVLLESKIQPIDRR